METKSLPTLIRVLLFPIGATTWLFAVALVLSTRVLRLRGSRGS